MKISMALAGLLFVFYVLMHMYGNLKLLFGQKAFDDYAHHLRTLGEPILPYSGFLWLFRLLLITALLVHVGFALHLWSKANRARSSRYVVKKAVAATVSSKMMRWGGIALLLFLVFHLIHFTILKPNFNSGETVVEGSPYSLVVAAFKLWWVVAIYLLAMIALGMHLHHGVWSAAQTLGLTQTAKSRATAKALGVLVALVVAVGFAIPPLAILFKIVGN